MDTDRPPPAGRRRIPLRTTPTDPQGPPTTSTTSAGDGADEHRVTVFDAVGGQRFFDLLVERFYARVANDQVLLRLYPDQQDLAPARERLALFLGQYWGGPTAYSQRRGHPRLRMRHGPFTIGATEKEHWLAAMHEALAEVTPQMPLEAGPAEELRRRMSEYFDMAAEHLVNDPH